MAGHERYSNRAVKVKKQLKAVAEQANALGINLGLKDLMTDSEGLSVESQRVCRDLESKLAMAQRAGNNLSDGPRVRYSAIFMGDVNAKGLAKTHTGKYVLDASRGKFGAMLQYKSDSAGAWFSEIDESCSTQVCHACDARRGPKGRSCADCGAQHHRNQNTAINIRQSRVKWR